MTREEAIQYAEKKIDSASYRLEMGYLNNGLRQIVSNEYEFFMQALSALRQQEHFRGITEKVEPITMDELREMPCEPVYIVAGYVSWWDIVSFAGMEYLYLKVEGSLPFRDYGKNWTAYRQMPEEVQK